MQRDIRKYFNNRRDERETSQRAASGGIGGDFNNCVINLEPTINDYDLLNVRNGDRMNSNRRPEDNGPGF